MAWSIEYTKTAKEQLRKLDKPVARRILDFMEKRVARQTTPAKVARRSLDLGGTFGIIALGITG